MIIKLRDRLRVFELVKEREEGMTFVQLASFVIAPVIFGAVAIGAVTLMRLGGDLTGIFTRDTQLNQMSERLQQQLTNITEIDVASDRAFTIGSQPSRQTAYNIGEGGTHTTTTADGEIVEVCVTNTWEFVDGTGGTTTLVNTETIHEGDSCDTPITKTSTWELTGFSGTTAFDYTNAYGRDLNYADGTEQGPDASTAERPENLFDNEWAFPEPGIVTVDGELNQAIGATPVKVTATTPMEQLRPGAVETNLGTLGAVAISRQHLQDDDYRSQFSALTELNDPRAHIEWSYRWAYNAGETTKKAAESGKTSDQLFLEEATDWTEWSDLDYHDHTIHQGAKWQIQAKYRVVLGNEIAESEESVIYTWVRPVATPDAPAAPKITLAGITEASLPNPDLTADITVTPGVCATETDFRTQPRHRVDGGSWSSYLDAKTAKPYKWTNVTNVLQGGELEAAARAMCVGAFDNSSWSGDGPVGDEIQPIVSKPDINNVDPELDGEKLIVDAQIRACPDGTDVQVRYRTARNDSGWGKYGSWQDVTNATFPLEVRDDIRQGDQGRVTLQARCVTENVPNPAAKPKDPPIATQPDPGWTVRPITATPDVTATLRIDGSKAITTSVVDGCPAYLSTERRWAGMTNERGGWDWLGGSGNWVGGDGADKRTTSTNIHQGARADARVDGRCYSKYADGDHTTGRADAKDRPITGKPNVTGARIDFRSGQKAAVLATVNSCPTGTDYEARLMMKRNGDTGSYSENSYTTAGNAPGTVTRTSSGTFRQGDRAAGGIRARCFTPFEVGPNDYDTTGWDVRAITSKPNVSNARVQFLSGERARVVATVNSCPAHLDYEARLMMKRNHASSWSENNYTSANNAPGNVYRESSGTYREGDRAAGGIRARCVSPYDDGPSANDTSGWDVRDITSRPSVSKAAVTFSGTTGTVKATVNSCPSHLDYQARFRKIKNETGGWDTSGWSNAGNAPGNVTRTSGTTFRQGEHMKATIQARCVSPFDQGPHREGRQGENSRNITVKPNVNASGKFVNSNDFRATATFNSCSNHMDYNFRWIHKRNGESTWTYKGWENRTSKYADTLEWNLRQGDRAAARAYVRCSTKWEKGPQVYNSTGWETRNIGAPSVSINTWLNGSNLRTNAAVSCPSHLTERARYGGMKNGQSNWDWLSGYKNHSGNETKTTETGIRQGERARATVQAFCAGPYATGPTTHKNSSWKERGISSKPSIWGTRNVIQKSSGWSNLRTYTNVGGCPAHLDYQLRWGHMKNNQSSWRWASGGWQAPRSGGGSKERNTQTGIREGDRARSTVNVRCVSPYVTGGKAWQDANNGWQVRGISDRIGLDSRNLQAYNRAGSGLAGHNAAQGWLGGDVCASHLTAQDRHRVRVQAGWSGNWGSWSTTDGWSKISNRTGTQTWGGDKKLNQGAKSRHEVALRCKSPWALGPATTFKDDKVRPITRRPSAVSRDISITGSGTVRVYSGKPSNCSAGTGPMWRANAGYWSGWVKNSGATVSAGSRGYGQRASGTIQARCYAPGTNTTGPTRSWGAGTSAPRPYPTPSAPSGVRASGQFACYNSGGVPAAGVQFKFNTSAYANYYQAYVRFRNADGNMETESVRTVSPGGDVIIASPYGGGGVTIYVRAVSSSGASGWATATARPGLGC